MISHIAIRDFAIIRELNLDLHPGLNIITGETGAGKSIIIEAISMALGARADTDYIRTGADKASITLTADCEKEAAGLLREEGAPEDDPLVIRRDISAGSRSLCRVNGTIVPLSFLARLCRHVADIHGQYDNQVLLDPANHVDVLDLYGQEDIRKVRGMVSELFQSMTRAKASLDALQRKMADAERRKDLARYELNEIDDAKLSAGEDEALEDDIRLMQHSEEIFRKLSSVYETAYGSDGSALERLSYAMSDLESVAPFSSELSEASQSFSDAYYALDDLGTQIRRLRDGISFSEEELEEKTDRLDLIDRLKRKYGGSIEAVFAYREKARAELDQIENADEEIEALKSELKLYQEQYGAAADRLSVLRKRAAKLFGNEVDKELRELNFADASLSVSVESCPATEKGRDAVEFLIRTNKGEAFKPLAKIASGGELSRIMLGLKRIIGDLDRIPCLIFDEIDAGISGATAGVVGEKLREIAKTHQVVCITHLPQIAALGDHHYRIEKTSDEISTHTTIVPLSNEQRVEELARLLSGTHITDAAREQARALLKQS